MINIAHAVSNYDKVDGDSSGKEILVTKWYKRTGGWLYLIKCHDRCMAALAAKYAELIANDDKYGYSSESGSGGRWSGFNSIKSLRANGLSVEEAIKRGHGNFDCSSFCLTCYILAGLNHKASGYTGSMVTSLKETGLFDIYEGGNQVASDDFAEIGALYLMPKAHVAMALETGSMIANKPVDNPEDLISYAEALGSVRIRKTPKTGKTVDILKKGQKAEIVSVDSDTGWLYVKHNGNVGYLTNNTRYVKL